MKKIISTLIITIFAISIFAKTGYYTKAVVDKPAMMGQPASEETVETYILGDKYKTISGNEITIIKDGKVFGYDTTNQTYYIQNISDLQAMSSMIDKQFEDFTLKKTDKTEKVGKWDTVRYDLIFRISGFEMVSEMYIADVGIPADIIQKKNTILYPDSPSLEKLTNELSSIEGMPVKMVVNIMGNKIVTLTEVAEKRNLTDSDFEGPSGFTKIEAPNPMQMMK